jgi:flavorubredoxin
MAYSWALVAQQWFYDEDDVDHHCDDCQYCDAVRLMAHLTPQFTATDRDAALALAEDVYAIARAHGAIWVPDPNPKYLAVFQRYLEGTL